ncbi:MAG TPA: T9SS type A sorting domain-containing protein [Flavipsychrobacter sp.]|nr:T9SS type A sorting domain-containing protein [Flavipsychrobacter sp.]
MKKLLLAAAAITTLATSADAALKKGDLAVDFSLPDINGVTYSLYTLLDSGYTVIIDESAAWCGPCWSMHQTHQFNNLMTKYGPSGTTTPKKIMVIFLEGESGNTTAQLYGPAGGSGATYTQGDWVTGTLYPIIDNPPTNVRDAYLDGGFPTFTVIGRDRIVYDQFAGFSSAMGGETFWTDYLNVTPNYAPSATVDAKVVDIDQPNAPFYCQATPTIRFQNYGASNLTSATLKVYSGSTVVSTQTWTGTLAPWAIQDVTMPAFTQSGPFQFEVDVTSDAKVSNNTLGNQNFAVMSSASAAAAPYSEDMEAATTDFPARITSTSDMIFFYGGTAVTGISGTPSKVAIVDFYNNQPGTTSELILSNFNTGATTNPAFEFDVAYAQYSGTENDKLEVFASKDCGVTWGSVWTKSGSALSTHAAISSGQFVPASSADWRHEIALLSNYKDPNVFIKIKATSAYGNLAFLDNFNLVSNATTSVDDVVHMPGISIYPNPATDAATLQFDAVNATNVTIQVVDLTGRVVANIANENVQAGSRKFTINTANLPSGIYNVKIQTESGSQTQRLSVIK